ncbi:MAG: hypothetical protein R3A79_16215 [Nannocystaceae bacterium]
MGADAGYDTLLARVSERLAGLRDAVFTTDADVDWSLADRFVAALPAELQQEYTCATCARFIAEFGGLVTIDASGAATPLVWAPDPAYEGLAPAVAALAERVAAAAVTGVYLNPAAQWGRAEHGGFRHLAGAVDASVRHVHPVDSAHQRRAELAKDFASLRRALLDEYSSDHIDVALGLLRGEKLFRGEKILGVAEWLADLDQRLREAAGKRYRTTTKRRQAELRDNLLWRAVAAAPPGFCRVRSTMIGTLLDDIAVGKPYAAVERAFRQKMDPLSYQRPQAKPSRGNLRDAEALIAKLGSASAFDRRFARLDDLETLWRSDVEPPAASTTSASSDGRAQSVFAGVESRDDSPKARALVGAGAQTITWEKLRRTALADAARIELWVPTTAHFYAFVTAVDPDAACVVQWDREDRRNPVTWYTHSAPPAAVDWSLTSGWHDLTAISLFPHQWADEAAFAHQTPGALLVVAGCWPKREGTGLFPEFLRAEYRPIRASVEALMRARELAGRDQASACGVALRAGVQPPQPLRLRVHPRGRGVAREYAVDRWD